MSDTGSFGGDDDLTFGIRFEYDGQDGERQAAEGARRLASIFDQIFERNPGALRQLGVNLSRPFDRAGDAAQDFAERVRRTAGASQELVEDLNALTARARAFRDTLRAQGGDANLFAVYDRELAKILEVEREVRDQREAIARDPELLNAYKLQAQTISRTLSGEGEAAQRFLVSIRDQRRQEASQALAELNAQYRREQDVRREARGRLVSQEQQFTTLENARIRTEGAAQVAQYQATARARIEIARFAFRQILFLEQQLSRAIRGAFSIIQSGLGRIAAGAARLGQVFNRSSRDLNDGLNGALIRRENALSRSFRRQEQIVNQSLSRQEQQANRLNSILSTGPLGVLSGRSRFGAAIGAGALIGGGLTTANLFTSGLDRFQTLERANLQLERILGSAAQARTLLDSLNEWAQGTPLALDLVTEIAVGILSMGTAAEDVLPQLTAITDAVAFTGGGADEIRRVGLAIRQVSSAGRLLGQDFNQIAQALPGLNLSQLLADQLTGGNTAELKKLREAGDVSASEFIEAFVAGIQADERIGGSTASLASTLSGQISNLNAAWRRLGAAIITEFEGPLRGSIRRLRDNLTFLAQFVAGDVTPPFLALRGAIIGVAVAMGAIVAARAAVQTLQLLGLAARFALTPFGFLVTAITAVGAAVGALRAVNNNFRYITDGIRDLAASGLATGLELVVDALGRLGEYVVRTVLPALGRLARDIFPLLIQAVRVVAAVFNVILIPAVRAGFGFLVETATELVPILRQYVIPAVVALGAAWFALNAPISLVITAAAALTAAIIILRSESSTAREFIDNLGNSIANLARRLGSVAGAVGAAALDAIRSLGEALGDLFSRIDYGRLATAVLGFVNELGRLLGQALTSRLTVQAGVALGASAIALAGSFLAGFAEGVITGLPGAIDAFIDSLRTILEGVGAPRLLSGLFSNTFSGIATIIAGTLLASSVLRAFSNAGSRAAGAFSGGLIPGIRNGFVNAFRGIELLRDPDRAIARAAFRQARTYREEFDRIMRNNARLGFDSQLIRSGQISSSSLGEGEIRRLTAEQQRYIQATGQATASALLFRNTWRDVLRDTGNRWQALQDRVAQTGGWGRVGQRAGVALVTAFGAVLAGRQGGTTGLLGVVSASLGALALGGPVVAGITAAAGGAALLWAEITKADEAAALLAETTTRIADTLRGLSGGEVGERIAENLREAVVGAIGTEGAATLSILPDGFFTRTAREIEAGGFSLDRSFQSIGRNLGLTTQEIRDNLELLRVDPELFAGFLESPAGFEILNASGEIDTALTQNRDSVLALQQALAEAGVPVESFVAVLTALDLQARATSEGQRLLAEETRTLADGSSAAARIIEDEIANALRGLEGTSPLDRLLEFETVNNAVARVTGLLDTLGIEGQDAIALIREELEGSGVFLDTELTDYVRALVDEWIRAGEAADLARASMNFSRDRIGIARFDGIGGEAPKLRINRQDADDVEELTNKVDLYREALSALNQQRTDGIRRQIDALTSRAEAAEDAFTRAREAITNFFAPDRGPARLVDELIGNLGSIGSQIEDGLRQGGIRGDAAVRLAVGDFEGQLAGIVQAGFDAGLRSQEEFEALLAPLRGALNEEVGESLTRILSTVDFSAGITPAAGGPIEDALNRAMAGREIETRVAAAFNARAEVDAIQRQLDSLNASLNVEIVFSKEQIDAALIAAGLPPAFLAGLNEAALNEQGLTGLELVVAKALAEEAAATATPAAQPTTSGPTITGPVTVEIKSGNTIATGATVVTTLGAIAAGKPLPPGAVVKPGSFF